MINFHCTFIPVVVLNSVITHTNVWFLGGEIHQVVKFSIFRYSSLFTFYSILVWVHNLICKLK